jgi:hypothetical protein
VQSVFHGWAAVPDVADGLGSEVVVAMAVVVELGAAESVRRASGVEPEPAAAELPSVEPARPLDEPATDALSDTPDAEGGAGLP